MKFVNVCYTIILFLHLTETFRVLAWLSAQQTLIISILSLVLNLIYIAFNLKTAKRLFNQKLILLWFSVIFLLPAIMMCFSLLFGYMDLSQFGYWISFNALFVSLFACALILSYNVSMKWILIIIWASVITTVVGFILNYTWLDLFRGIGKASNSDKSWVVYGADLTRGVSFFVAPNRAAFACICFLIVLLATREFPKKINYYLYCILIMVSMIFVTGSRTSLIVIFLLLILYFSPVIYAVLNKRYKIRKNDAITILPFIFIVGMLLFLGFVNLVSIVLTSYGNPLGERLSIFNQLGNSISDTSSVQDESFSNRIAIIGTYLNEIKQNLLFGVGPEYIRQKLSSGRFKNVSQNQFIEGSLEYGILYTIFYCYVLIRSFFYSKKATFKDYKFNSLKVFIFFLFILGFSINDLFWNRPIVIILGLIIGQFCRNDFKGIRFKATHQIQY